MEILISASMSPALLKEFKKYPRRIAHQLDDNTLTKEIKLAIDAYHNEGKSHYTDDEYDILKDELEARYPNHPLLRRIGAEVPKARTKVVLPYSLFSLDKVKPDEPSFDRWVKTHPGPYIVSDKEDGLSLEIIYDKGKPSKIYTRGDGKRGQDVTHLTEDLGIPLRIPEKSLFVVRAEVAMEEQHFERYYSKETQGDKAYENSRNLVAGVVNTLKKKHPALAHIQHIAYEVIEPRDKPSNSLLKLKQYGFNVVPYKRVQTLDKEELIKYLEKRKKLNPFGMDGLVIEQDKKTTRPTNGNPDYAVAFKVTSEDDAAVTEVTDVVWEESKHRVLNPVILIKPVRLSGVTVKRITGNNAHYILTGRPKKDKTVSPDKPIGKGALVRVIRSGDVIPKIIAILKPASKPQLPNVPYEWDATKTKILLAEESNLVTDKRIEHFFKTIGVEGLKLATITKLADNGLTDEFSIIRARSKDFLDIEGFQKTSAEKLWNNIHKVVDKGIDLATLMDASSMFGQGFGTRRADLVLQHIPNLLEDYENKGSKYLLNKVLAIPGFQDKTAQRFVKRLPDFIEWLEDSDLKVNKPKTTKIASNKLQGKTIVFTGFRNKDLETWIESNGGKVGSGVSRNTNILLTKNIDNSTKLQKAKELGIEILTEEDFVKKYK